MEEHENDDYTTSSLNFKMQMQERKVREKRTPRDFYAALLKHELHPVCQGNLSLTLHYSKRFTKY